MDVSDRPARLRRELRTESARRSLAPARRAVATVPTLGTSRRRREAGADGRRAKRLTPVSLPAA